MNTVDVRHFHLFAGLGGGARGFNRGEARVGQLQARFRCIACMKAHERSRGPRGSAYWARVNANRRSRHG